VLAEPVEWFAGLTGPTAGPHDVHEPSATARATASLDEGGAHVGDEEGRSRWK